MYIIDMDAHPPMGEVNVKYVGKMDKERFFDRLTQLGIEKVCGTLTAPEELFENHTLPEAVSRINHAAMELSVKDSRYIPAVMLHSDMSTQTLEEFHSMGVKTVEIDVSAMNTDSEIIKCAEKLGMFAVLTNDTLDSIKAFAEKYPGLSFSAFGRTGKYIVPQVIYGLIEKHPNIYLSTSGAMWNFNYIVHQWAEKMQDRLIFGTAYPNKNPAAQLSGLKWELRDSGDEINCKVFHNNALKVLGSKGW